MEILKNRILKTVITMATLMQNLGGNVKSFSQKLNSENSTWEIGSAVVCP